MAINLISHAYVKDCASKAMSVGFFGAETCDSL